MTLQEQLISEARRLLQQGVEFVDGLDDAGYRHVEERLSTSSIGAHVRHCIDHVHAFLHGVPEGRVDYDRRRRDVRIEEDRGHATGELTETIERLGELSCERSRALLVRMDVPEGAQGAAGLDGGVWASSTVERELQGVVSHTVHHFALIAILVRAQGRTTAQDFGVARSTLDYWHGAGRTAAGVASQRS